jgi:D-3-phosphoglycerate dehydrogenase / 2-oxoglutarate reductase
MKTLILEPDGFPVKAIATLQKLGPVVLGPGPDSHDAEAVFVRLSTTINATFHKRFSKLRWIISPTTGLNHIDVDYFAKHNVELLSLRGRTEFLDNIPATAEHTLALVLALNRKLPQAVNSVRDGHWDRYPFQGTELFGKTVLILGYGRIGRQVHARYQAFGCKIIANDIDETRVPRDLWRPVPDAFAEADILSVHLPYGPTTHGYVDAAILAMLKPGCILVNTSRGEILCQNDVFSALRTGQLAGAALDVLDNEPAPINAVVRDALRELGDRLLITPHISGFTYESLSSVETFMAEQLYRAFLAKK